LGKGGEGRGREGITDEWSGGTNERGKEKDAGYMSSRGSDSGVGACADR